MKASILIRTKNEADAIASTIDALLDQTDPPQEIVVIDSGSTDDTVSIVEAYPVKLLHISPEEWSYPGALNRAAAASTGDVLVCLSAHCRPASRTWLSSLLGHFDDPVVAGVWGPNLREGRDSISDEPPERQLPGTYTMETRSWGLSNANSAIRRSLWELEPFDEELPATEDKAWGLAMLNRGYEMVYEPRAAVFHASHSLHGSYARNQAVQAGYRMIFPELDDAHAAQLRTVARRIKTLVKMRAGERDVRGLLADARRLPNVAASIIGGMVGAARRLR